MVPINLDALHLETEKSVVEAMADFSRLPYFDGSRDVNPDIANISEEIVSQPFQNQNLPLKPGIHLHWALPDALTKGIQNGEKTTFPTVPNRWLVTRRLLGKVEKQWVVESDYLYPEGKGSLSGSVNIPYHTDGKHQPFRYLGRKMPLAAWKESNSEYLKELTAVGYGDPTFAAFYPNCHSVFGFYDDDYVGNSPKGLQYDLIGWYSKAEQDYFKVFIGNLKKPTPTHEELLEAIKEKFKWRVSLEPKQDVPKQMICYARLTFDEKKGSSENLAKKAADTEITVGNTGTEALSAYLATKIDSRSESKIEEQLEALHLSSRLEHRQLDIGAKFKEARHEKGFNPVPAGCIWTVKQETESTKSANAEEADKREQITLPDKMAHLLNRVNCLQQAYNQAGDEIESMREQIFADWYKYMICAYPPEGSRDDYPDIDEVRYYIETKGIAPLNRKIAATGRLMVQKDASGKITAASAFESHSGSLASQLAAAMNGLITAINDLNNSEPVKKAKATYTLKPVPAPRYWQPNEPVVLITGGAVPPTPRHNQDGRLREDGLLDCQVFSVSSNTSVQEFIKSNSSIVSQKIDEIKEGIGFSTWTQQPWHPFLLEWQVEIFPIENLGNLNPDSRNYARNFSISNHKLIEKEPGLAIQEGQGRITEAANVYSGRSILTPHAGIQLKNQIEAYLVKQGILNLYYQEQNIAEEKQKVSYLDKQIDEIVSWYKNKDFSDPIYTAIRAYQKLKDLNCLSQVLSGFNQALLMHKQTLQLEIADPLGFDDYQGFTKNVRDAVQKSNRSAPEPLNDFNPIRSGAMKILQLRLVDTFGQVKKLDVSRVNTTEVMRNLGSRYLVSLPPRLVQPARLNFRWLSASQGEEEMNDHPATTPICGWVLANNLDRSLMIYDNQGTVLGSINREAKWESAPGKNPEITVEGIGNPYLQRMVRYLIERGSGFLGKFIDVLDTSLENIEPENYAQHQGLALLMGRPLAVVRASLNLELQGLPAINESWHSFRQDLRRNGRDDDDFTGVEFPIRLGEYHQLNDGLVGYWKEKGKGYEGDIFYAPQTDSIENEYIKSHSDGSLSIRQSLDSAPHILTMLVEPRGKVHATSGILPTKVIDIPPDQYADALQKIEITFLSTPILTHFQQLRLPLPDEPGYSWSWLEKENGNWREIANVPRIEKAVFQREFGKVIWTHLLDERIGWLMPMENNVSQAIVPVSEQRKSPRLGEGFQKLEEIINEILIRNSHAGIIEQQAFLERINTGIAPSLWTHLVEMGWLKVVDESKARVVPKDSRNQNGGKTLGEPFTGLEGQVEIIFDVYRISPVSTQAEFSGQQVIREGWLKLSQLIIKE